jgi:ubiquinone/menaquinone biosynthesis C-methylase UbiE
MIANKNNCSKAFTSFYQEEKLDLDSWFKISQIDYEKLIELYPFQEMFTAFGKAQISLLDIGCGISKFSSLLDNHISGDIHLSVDILDTSNYCLEKSQQVLTNLNNFTVDSMYLTDLKNINLLIPTARKYDLIWAIHSVYGIDKNSIHSTIESWLKLLNSHGKILIYVLSEDSFYYKLHDLYLKKEPELSMDRQQYLTAENLQKSIKSLGISYQSHEISFEHIVDKSRQQVLNKYVRQCILDHNSNLVNLSQEWFSRFLDKDRNQYKFPQIVKLLTIENTEVQLQERLIKNPSSSSS